jgi:hypothetical protein
VDEGTGSFSKNGTNTSGNLTREDFPSTAAYIQWARTMLELYAETADGNVKEAEQLVLRALELRDQAHMITGRAAKIASELAKVLDSLSHEDVNW